MYNSGAEISETGRVTLPEHQDRKVASAAQEIMANTTTMPMPMHVGLSLYILKQTGSKELVRILILLGNTLKKHIPIWCGFLNLHSPRNIIGFFYGTNNIVTCSAPKKNRRSDFTKERIHQFIRSHCEILAHVR